MQKIEPFLRKLRYQPIITNNTDIYIYIYIYIYYIYIYKRKHRLKIGILKLVVTILDKLYKEYLGT